MSGPGSPETSMGAEKKVDLGLDKVKLATANKLGKLKEKVGPIQTISPQEGVEASESTEKLMLDLIEEGVLGLIEDLKEAGIPEAEHSQFIQEFRTNVNTEMIKIKSDHVLELAEFEALETFMTDVKHFRALEKAIAEKKVSATIDEFLGTMKEWKIDLGGFANITGEKIVKDLAWIASLLGMPSLFGVAAKEKNKTSVRSPEVSRTPENFETQEVTELLIKASKTGVEGESARKYLEEKFPESEFGTMKVSEAELKFIKPNQQERIFKFGRNNLGKPLVIFNSEEKEFDGKTGTLLPLLKEWNKTDPQKPNT